MYFLFYMENHCKINKQQIAQLIINQNYLKKFRASLLITPLKGSKIGLKFNQIYLFHNMLELLKLVGRK